MNIATQTALYTRLTGGAALTALLSAATAVYHIQAPQGAVLPYVVFFSSSDQTETVDPRRRENELITVKGLAATDLAAAQIAEAVDALLDDKPLTVTGFVNIWLRRTSGIPPVYIEAAGGGGEFVYQRGALYRLWLARSR